jgi:hypothetical protein
MAEVRIATFNLENFDETAPDEWPSLAERIQLMRPQIVRLRANIACSRLQPSGVISWKAIHEPAMLTPEAVRRREVTAY